MNDPHDHGLTSCQNKRGLAERMRYFVCGCYFACTVGCWSGPYETIRGQLGDIPPQILRRTLPTCSQHAACIPVAKSAQP